MKERTKLTLAVGIGTIAIELSLFLVLSSVFVETVKLIMVHEAKMDTTGKALMIVGLVTGLALMFLVYSKASDYLRARMCWALVRHFHEKG
jgi:hypothetical protein